MSSLRPNYARDINLIPPINITNVWIVLISVSLLQAMLDRALDTNFNIRQKEIRKVIYNLCLSMSSRYRSNQLDILTSCSTVSGWFYHHNYSFPHQEKKNL